MEVNVSMSSGVSSCRSPEGGLSVGLGAGTGSVGVGSPTMGSAHAHHGALSSPAPDVHGRVSVNAVELDALHQELAALLQWKQNAEDTMGRLHHQLGMSHQLIFELTESVRALSDQQRQLGRSCIRKLEVVGFKRGVLCGFLKS